MSGRTHARPQLGVLRPGSRRLPMPDLSQRISDDLPPGMATPESRPCQSRSEAMASHPTGEESPERPNPRNQPRRRMTQITIRPTPYHLTLPDNAPIKETAQIALAEWLKVLEATELQHLRASSLSPSFGVSSFQVSKWTTSAHESISSSSSLTDALNRKRALSIPARKSV